MKISQKKDKIIAPLRGAIVQNPCSRAMPEVSR